MSDSDSDYIVEEYIKPDVIRKTNSNDEEMVYFDSDQEKSESDSGEIEEIQEIEAEENKSDDEIHITNCRFILHVSNITSETSKEELERLFSTVGEVKAIRIPKRKSGIAFVEMISEDGLKRAFSLSGTEMNGKNILVKQGSKNKKHGPSKIAKQKKKKINVKTFKSRTIKTK